MLLSFLWQSAVHMVNMADGCARSFPVVCITIPDHEAQRPRRESASRLTSGGLATTGFGLPAVPHFSAHEPLFKTTFSG